MADLRKCPFCGGEAELEKYYETCDGRGDRPARIKCKCGLGMSLTWNEFKQTEKDFGYNGGYYSSNKKFWEGMHQRLIEKWNTRKPMEAVVAELEKFLVDGFDCSDCPYDYLKSCKSSCEAGAFAKAISIVREKE